MQSIDIPYAGQKRFEIRVRYQTFGGYSPKRTDGLNKSRILTVDIKTSSACLHEGTH